MKYSRIRNNTNLGNLGKKKMSNKKKQHICKKNCNSFKRHRKQQKRSRRMVGGSLARLLQQYYPNNTLRLTPSQQTFYTQYLQTIENPPETPIENPPDNPIENPPKKKTLLGRGAFGTVYKFLYERTEYVVKEVNISFYNNIGESGILNEIMLNERMRYPFMYVYTPFGFNYIDDQETMLKTVYIPLQLIQSSLTDLDGKAINGMDQFKKSKFMTKYYELKLINDPDHRHDAMLLELDTQLAEILYMYLLQNAMALYYLHEMGLAHHDIKLLNTMINQEGYVIPIDFGEAVCIKSSNLTPYNCNFAENPATKCPTDRDKHKILFPEMSGTFIYLSPNITSRQCESYKMDFWALVSNIYELINNEDMSRDINQDKGMNVYYVDLFCKLKHGDDRILFILLAGIMCLNEHDPCYKNVDVLLQLYRIHRVENELILQTLQAIKNRIPDQDISILQTKLFNDVMTDSDKQKIIELKGKTRDIFTQTFLTELVNKDTWAFTNVVDIKRLPFFITNIGMKTQMEYAIFYERLALPTQSPKMLQLQEFCKKVLRSIYYNEEPTKASFFDQHSYTSFYLKVIGGLISDRPDTPYDINGYEGLKTVVKKCMKNITVDQMYALKPELCDQFNRTLRGVDGNSTLLKDEAFNITNMKALVQLERPDVAIPKPVSVMENPTAVMDGQQI